MDVLNVYYNNTHTHTSVCVFLLWKYDQYISRSLWAIKENVKDVIIAPGPPLFKTTCTKFCLQILN